MISRFASREEMMAFVDLAPYQDAMAGDEQLPVLGRLSTCINIAPLQRSKTVSPGSARL